MALYKLYYLLTYLLTYLFLLQVVMELFRVYVFNAKDKSFLVPMLSSDWRCLSSRGHVSWSLWNSHTLRNRASSVLSRQNLNLNVSCYVECSSHNCVVESVIAATPLAQPADELMNNHEVCVKLIIHKILQ